MEQEFDICTPLTPAKPPPTPNPLGMEWISGGLVDSMNKNSPTLGFQLCVDLYDAVDTGSFNFEERSSSNSSSNFEVQTPTVPQDIISDNAKVRDGTEEMPCSKDESNKLKADENLQDGVGSIPPASDTPLQQSSKKRHNSGTDLNKKPRQRRKLKKHRAKILDDSNTKRTRKAKTFESNLQPRTPLKRCTPRPHMKRKSYVRTNISKVFSSPSEGIVPENADRSCKQALNFNFENQTEDGCNSCEDDNTKAGEHIPKYSTKVTLDFGMVIKDEKQVVVQHQRKDGVDNTDFNLGICEPNIFTKVDNATVQSNQESSLCHCKSDNCIQNGCMSSSQQEAVINLVGCSYNPLQVYHRIYRENQCVKNSKKSGPNFPRIYKKPRIRRERITTYRTWGTIRMSKVRQWQSKGVQNVKLKYMHKGVKNSKKNFSPDISHNDAGCCNSIVSFQPAVNLKGSKGYNLSSNFVSQNANIFSVLSPLTYLLQAESAMVLKYGLNACTEASLSKKGKVTKRRPSLKNQVVFNNSTHDALLDVVLRKFKKLSISENSGQLVVRDTNEKKQEKVKVEVDDETLRVYNIINQNGGDPYDEEVETDPEKKEYWAKARHALAQQVNSFMSIMRIIQGDRRFSQWKGSVVDSVVGAYLTQNVSDHLSSSAFMALAARFPAQNSTERNTGAEATASDPNASMDNDQVPPDSCLEEELRTETDGNENTSSSDGLTNKAKTKQEVEEEVKKQKRARWKKLWRMYFTRKARTEEAMDAVDWEAVRCAPVGEIADIIKQRGMNNVLAKKIQDFLNRLVKLHGSIDLEWLRDVPPKDVKDYLMDIHGIGLKSVECVRLLTLRHVAFPVDTNVGRAAVRLGWVPLAPLPGNVQMHNIDIYPLVDLVQKYLYPRLCNWDHQTLYELHYHLITFGKVFCTKKNPNCNPCPMKDQCKHFASAFASFRLSGPESKSKDMKNANGLIPVAVKKPDMRPPQDVGIHETDISDSEYKTQDLEEEEPMVEFPLSPEPEPILEDIEDIFKDTDGNCAPNDVNEFDDNIPIIRLNKAVLRENILDFVQKNDIPVGGDLSNTLAVLDSVAPLPPMKHVGRLRTIHKVYELPDSHPLLKGVEGRDPDDPCRYLFAVWEEGKVENSFPQTTNECKSCEPEVCHEVVCSYSNFEEHRNTTVTGSLLVPTRTSNKGRFPLNGTYFQVNEVFADHETTQRPVTIPKNWIVGLPYRLVYCGASATSIFKGLSLDQIQHAFWKGFTCTRGFNRITRYPMNLSERLHIKTTMQGKKKKTSRQ